MNFTHSPDIVTLFQRLLAGVVPEQDMAMHVLRYTHGEHRLSYDISPFLACCMKGYLCNAMQMAARGARLHYVWIDTRVHPVTFSSPVAEACRNGHFEIARWILTHPACPPLFELERYSSELLLDICKNDAETVTLLHRLGARSKCDATVDCAVYDPFRV